MRDLTILWALRSPCNLGCTYCYFGTIEEHRVNPPEQAGQMSHVARDDISLADITGFLSTAASSAIARVFIAGGEPLIWPPVFQVVAMLKEAGIEVVLCTNGIPLNRPQIIEKILCLGVDAVSVSLDSTDPAYNDRYRPARNHRDGHAEVLAGIKALLGARGDRGTPKTGLYTVVTRRNIPAVTKVARLAVELGADYFVPQPISLNPAHPLHDELALRERDLPELVAELATLYGSPPKTGLPDRSYTGQFLSAVAVPTQLATECFGGHRLAFIEPNGSVWPCPSSYKIADTPPERHRTIRGSHAARLFPRDRGTCPHDCPLMSVDCVNMWPLMAFDRFIHKTAAS
jgi:MoaA/NifB/PqqE/SkfB family radical SAM enzyme